MAVVGTNTGICIKGLTLGYKNGSGGGRILCREAGLEVAPNTVCVLLGRNGTGKSTLLRSIARVHTPLTGEIFIGENAVWRMTDRELSEVVSFVSTEIVNTRNLAVWDMVGLGRAPYTNWIGQLAESDSQAVARAIELVGMGGFERKSISSLSDGERQRVMIARALAQDTPVMVLDEPTAFLDVPNRYEIALLLCSLAHKHGKTILYSTHDLEVALQLADRLCLIVDGRFSTGTPEELIQNGVIDTLFERSPLTFDPATKQIKLTL
ncbi:MAG: ABC transporter ATP-binding protein [Rikenellaceae bacterium]|jgi:iron complex transport system ATP-binding protein|nr:ABC transporter ATP-binding protein [Rikenellaceae bacterium]